MSRTATSPRHQTRRMADVTLPDKIPDEKVLSPNQIAGYLGLTGEAIKCWIYKNNLKAVKHPNGYWKVRAGDLRRFLAERKEFVHKIFVNFHDPKVIEAIENLGHRIVVSTNYADTVLKIMDTQPGLFIFNTSEQTFKLIGRLRNKSLQRALARRPVILVGPDNFDIDRAAELRCSAFVPEPVNPEQLKNEVMRLFNQ